MSGLTNAASPAVISLVHIVLAAGVTGHALLHKRDPGSAVAWIGLAWLAPILGSTLYLLLGINRVRRRAMNLRSRRPATRVAQSPRAPLRDDHLAQLEYTGQRITGRAAEAGNAVTILRSGD